MTRLRALRGKVKSKKGEGKRAMLKGTEWGTCRNFLLFSSSNRNFGVWWFNMIKPVSVLYVCMKLSWEQHTAQNVFRSDFSLLHVSAPVACLWDKCLTIIRFGAYKVGFY
jgi:hypothetical protein